MSECYFKECEECIYREYNNDLVCCVSNRLRLAFHRLFMAMPIINKFISKDKHCYWFERDEYYVESKTNN